jgi:hypothetical protein
MKYSTIYELPEIDKFYDVILSNNLSFSINGEQKEAILNSKDQFIRSPNGEVFNRSFIRAIILNKDKTRNRAKVKNLLSP